MKNSDITSFSAFILYKLLILYNRMHLFYTNSHTASSYDTTTKNRVEILDIKYLNQQINIHYF